MSGFETKLGGNFVAGGGGVVITDRGATGGYARVGVGNQAGAITEATIAAGYNANKGIALHTPSNSYYQKDATDAYEQSFMDQFAPKASGILGNPAGFLRSRKPLILDLDGTGVELTQLQNSTVFVDSSGDGLLNRTAWAAAGNGVLFYDADGDGTISEKREYVFTEWDPTATSDIEALRAVFDSNGDGVFDANDDKWADFKVLVTNADGSLEAKTLAELGITSIDLTADATNIELPDGSVITGKTTFTRSDGTTGTVADTTLVSETASYRVEESEAIDSEGMRTHIQTGYGADGAISFVITSVTTADGASITNSYDDNGDGVVDRIQTIVTVSNPDGSESETVTNKVGSDFATGILINATKTTTSADGNTVTIERDSTGGGWYDQTEVRTTHGDDSMAIVTTDRDPNGGVIRSSSETVSADGLVRTDAIDEDGDGVVDLTITHTIVINADDSRSETIEHFNQDGSLRSSVTENVSADGQTKTITRDLDGDGDTDVQEELDIAVNADGTTDSTLTVKNGDGSLRSSTTHTQSEDALTKTSAVDQDGDGDTDLTTVEATVINADGSRETETTQTNTDGSVRAKTKVTLGSDQVSSETWIDHNQDGTFQATDLSRSVTVDGVTGERTTTSWTRNADGSFSAQSVSTSSQDGLVVNTNVDSDGDGDTDLSVSDVTVENADGTSTRTVTEQAQNGALRSAQETTTSADGLAVTTLSDVNGDSSNDGRSVSTRVSNADGSTLQTTTSYAGDEVTLLGETTTSQSADRRLTITTIDANGDGATDTTLRSDKHADGSMTELETRFSADGTTLFAQQTDVSEDGLTVTVATDREGDGDTDATSVQATVLNADGGRTTTSTARNGDNSLRSQSATTVSDDGLVTTTTEDSDGDGTSERSVTSTTELRADGSRQTIVDARSSDGTLLTRSDTTVSDDGLIEITGADTDGDESADIVTTRVTTLNDDGSTTVTADIKDITGASDILRSQVVTTTSDNGRDILEMTDINGDGQVDMRVHRVIGDDGHVTLTETELNSDGSLQSRMITETDDAGLESTTHYDTDGDGSYERRMESTTVLNADGSTTQTAEEKAEDGTVYRRNVTETSRDGWTTTVREDRDADGDDDLTTAQVFELSAAGVETTTITRTAADGSTLGTDTSVVSADKRSTTRSVDADGNGVNDMVLTANVADDGTQNRQTQYYDDTGALIASTETTVSGDGLTTTTRRDRNGDGTDELIATAATALAADGSRTQTADYTDGSGTLQARTVTTTSDDGLSSNWSADLDGDGTNEFVTSSATTFESDGDVVQTSTTVDGAGAAVSGVTTTSSGNGLSTSTQIDVNGDGANDIVQSRTTQADGAWAQTNQQFGSDASLVQSAVTSQSADGRTLTTRVDEDGDGTDDRDLVIQVDLNRTTTSTWRDLATNGSAETVIVGTELSNGTETDYAFDLDGDGAAEFTRGSNMQYDAAGNSITEIEEQHGGRLTFSRTVTDAADGLSQTVETDIDGDGDTDATSQMVTTLHDDGRQTVRIDATYADGATKSTLVRETSADGRTVTETRDYDGDGNIDLETTSTIGSDGRSTSVERSFDVEGELSNTKTTSVSADGLVTTITTDETSFTINGSPVGNGSYETSFTGEDTSFTSEHQVDGAGIETWSLQRTEGLITSSFEVRLDANAKARVIAEAERLYDTLLDRDLDNQEYETLAAHIENGELNLVSLAEELIASDEFQARFPGFTNGAFIDQVFTNALGRGASLAEFDAALTELSSNGMTQAQFAAQISESSEHLVVGNGHMATNNFNVLLSPAQAERSTDRAYIKATATRAIDILYGKSLFDPALTLATLHVVNGSQSMLEFATSLVDETAVPDPDSDFDLSALSDEQFVRHVVFNALGQESLQTDLGTWQDHLSSGRMTRGELVVLLARSTEYLATPMATQNSSTFVRITTADAADFVVGTQLLNGVYGDDRNNVISATASSSQNQLAGGDGDDTIRGGVNADILIGDAGADIIYGYDGDDVLFIDADDLTSGDVQAGGGHDVAQIMGSDDTTLILMDHGLEGAYGGDGNDVISAEGLTTETKIYGGGGDDTLTGSGENDRLYGDSGSDQIRGGAGHDILVGGTGNDILIGDEETSSGANYYTSVRLDSIGDHNSVFNSAEALSSDVDGDGQTDVVFSYFRQGSGPDGVWYRSHLSEGDGEYISTSHHTGDGSGILGDAAPQVGDFNGDGLDDILFALNYNGKLQLRTKFSDGDGTYSGATFTTTYSSGVFRHTAPLVGDFNGDGRDDVAVFREAANGKINFGILTSNGDGTFSSQVTFTPYNNALVSYTSPLVGDFNGDGRDDITFQWYSSTHRKLFIRNYTSEEDGSFSLAGSTFGDGTVVFSAGDPHVGDFNGDGRDDFAYIFYQSGSTMVRVRYGQEDGTFAGTNFNLRDGRPLLNTLRPDVADYTGDGNADISFVFRDTDGEIKHLVYYYEDDAFQIAPIQSNGYGAFDNSLASALTGDFDGNGQQDYAYAFDGGQYGLSDGLHIQTAFSFNGGGFDVLIGGEGDDELRGGAGSDVLEGGAGSDILEGGINDDLFIYKALKDSTVLEHDTILDFEAGIDHIDFTELDVQSFEDLVVTIDGDETVVSIADEDFEIRLSGTEHNLGENDFLFA